MNVSDFDFELPEELIAQHPPPERGESRLLVLERASGRITHTTFAQLSAFFRRGDLLVVNNTRVFPARLLGTRVPSGGAVEFLLLRRIDPDGSLWDALVHPGQKLKVGAQAVFGTDEVRVNAEVIARHFHGRRTVRLWAEGAVSLDAAIDRIGHIPLPPYIKREDTPQDLERYQTVYARDRGSVAAPTAGLHFTPALLDRLADAGVSRTDVTLHVGYGTFKPVRADRVEDHEVDPEPFTVSPEAADALNEARAAGRRVIAVGTTTVRALESLALDSDGRVQATGGQARLFIRPGHEFRVVQGLVTNFHLPRSSLLMLVAAFGGREIVVSAYRDAVARRYRFYSYGDAMLIV